jgi:WD40 repeat protein
VTATVDESVKVWEMATGRLICTLEPPHPVRLVSVAFQRNGQLLASASVDGTIKLWDNRTWKQQEVLRGSSGGVQSLAFSPEGRLLAWGGRDATVKIWDARTKQILRLRGHTSWVVDVAFSPDGERIASASLDGTVKIWKVPPLEESPEVADQ